MSNDIEQHKRIVHRFYDDLVTGGDLALIDEITVEDVQDDAWQARGGLPLGREGIRTHIEWVRASVGDVVATVTELVAEGDTVIVHWTIEGTQLAPMFDVPIRGNRFKGRSISTIRFRDGRISYYTVLPDRDDIRRQLLA